MALQYAIAQKEKDEKKQRLLEKKLDYAYLEELVQNVNENPSLRIKITHKDGMIIEIDTTPKKKPNFFDDIEIKNDFIEVK